MGDRADRRAVLRLIATGHQVLEQVDRSFPDKTSLQPEAKKIGYHIPRKDEQRTQENIKEHVVVKEPRIRIINQASQ